MESKAFLDVPSKDEGTSEPGTIQEAAAQVSQNVCSEVTCTLHEIVPSHEKLKPTETWESDQKSRKNVKKYYKKQEDLLSMLAEVEETSGSDHSPEQSDNAVVLAAKVSLACNVIFLIAKAVACYLSGSLSVISSLVDSAIDLVSGVMIWLTNRSIKVTNFYEYPVGKTRLEPLAITVMSVIMSIASLQLIIEAVQSLLSGSIEVDVGISTIIIICFTIATKILLYLYCRRHKFPSTKVLAQDHRNDVFSNTFALVLGYIGSKFWKQADPLGAILISVYIGYGWFKVGWQQVRELSGHVATPERLTQLLHICCTFDSRIQYIDTLRAYHFGSNLIVEVHIVLPPNITLQEAHDIGEPLQQKLTACSFVERAFVHMDYEYEHRPGSEQPNPGSTNI